MSREFRGSTIDKVSTISEFFASLADLANIQSSIDKKQSAYRPEGVATEVREAREQLMGDFKQACSLLPDHEEKQGLIETGERLLVNALVKFHRSERLVRKLNLFAMVDKAMVEVRKFFHKNMPKVWVKSSGDKYGTGRGGGKGKGFDGGRGGRRGPCYTCGSFGHLARDCLLGATTTMGRGKGASSWFLPFVGGETSSVGPEVQSGQQQLGNRSNMPGKPV